MIGEIHYEIVPDLIWSIDGLTDIWGIGPRMTERLNRLQIHNMYELIYLEETVTNLKRRINLLIKFVGFTNMNCYHCYFQKRTSVIATHSSHFRYNLCTIPFSSELLESMVSFLLSHDAHSYCEIGSKTFCITFS